MDWCREPWYEDMTRGYVRLKHWKSCRWNSWVKLTVVTIQIFSNSIREILCEINFKEFFFSLPYQSNILITFSYSPPKDHNIYSNLSKRSAFLCCTTFFIPVATETNRQECTQIVPFTTTLLHYYRTFFLTHYDGREQVRHKCSRAVWLTYNEISYTDTRNRCLIQ